MENPTGICVAIGWPLPETAVPADVPVSFGVGLPMGRLIGPCAAWLTPPADTSAPQIAAQTEVLGRWPDGSVRWILLDAVLPAGTVLSGDWEAWVEPASEDDGTDRLRASADDETIRINWDRWQTTFDHGRGEWRLSESCSDGAVDLATVRLPPITDEKGIEHAPVVAEARLVTAGSVRATMVVTGSYPEVRDLQVETRMSVFSGTGLIQMEITLHNPQRASHGGGLWDLGDAGSVLFRDYSMPIVLVGRKSASIRYQIEAGAPVRQTADRSVNVYQDSSGGENWNSRNHVNRDGKVPCQFAGYRGAAGDEEFSGKRAEPVVEMCSSHARLAAIIPEFWQQFPKAIEAAGNEIRLRLFPGQSADLFELQGGEQKTHQVWLRLDACGLNRGSSEGSASGAPAASCDCTIESVTTDLREAAAISRRQPLPRVEQGWLPGLPDYRDLDSKVVARLDGLMEEFLSGPRGILALREEVDEYGWRNFGDLHADHEEQHYRGPMPLISHYNNQFDVLCGFLLHFLRTGHSQWMELADSLARHVIDIDIYHTERDRPAYNGGLFWFTDHYLHANTSTHRTFSRHNRPAVRGSYGGGPGAEHNYSSGLLLYHVLTGNPLARHAVLCLGEWVLAMDDGSRTFLGMVDEGPTGLASSTGDPLYHGPGRGSGNSISALLNSWLISLDRKYLQHAESLIHRCIHPEQDLEALDLLNAEKRWSYPIFLVSLSKYLDCKVEAGEIDAEYDYAQSSLLHVGRWMLENERPYFDRKDELEYPTEAWPAQELRKANAIRLAAQHADEPWRTRMLDRGDELAERAWDDLMKFSTRTTARAMAVVMVEGLRDAELRRRIQRSLPRFPGTRRFPPSQSFVPQRERVKDCFRSPLSLLGLLTKMTPQRLSRLFNPR